MFQDIRVLDSIPFLENLEQSSESPVLRAGKRDIMIAFQLDSQRIVAETLQPSPHADPGMVGPILGV
jgi:hypothetical protein